MNNGHLSDFFRPQRGVRQGCPLSLGLFVIVIELLALYIKQHSLIEGVQNNTGESYLISQFADDTSFAIINSKENVHTLFHILPNVGRLSGLNINIEKSELLLLGIGSLWDVPQEYRKLVKDKVKLLEIYITTDLKKQLTLTINLY